MRCPTCGGNVIITNKSYICGCVTLPKVILGKVITPEIVHELLTNRRTKILDGFVSRRNGKVFSAALAVENGRVKFRFDGGQEDEENRATREGRGNIVKIRVHSGNSGMARVAIKGAVHKEFQISYGHVSSRMAECLACITAAGLIKHIMKNTTGVKLDISLNNLDFSRYILKERVPRDKEMRGALDRLFAAFDEFRNWKVRYEPEKRSRLVGSPHSDRFPRGVFPGIDVKVEEGGNELVVRLPAGRPDVRAQFAASIRNAVPGGDASYTAPLTLKPVVMAWLASVKKG